MEISFSMIQTIGLAIIVLLIGRFLRSKIKFFQDFAIPAPVIGGVLFSILNLILRQTGTVLFEFDTTLQDFFMIIFFTSIGFNASIATLKAGGPMVIKFLIVASVLCVFQNIVALGLSGIVDVEPGLALMTGSTPMTGGHGTAAAISTLVEDAGIIGAETVAVTAATFGLVAGSLMGGPVANRLINSRDLVSKKQASKEVLNIDESLLATVERPLSGERINMAFFVILIAMGVGTYISDFLNSLVGNITELASFPAYIGPMILAIIARYISDKGSDFVPAEEVEIVGSVGLNIFLAMALMTLKLWELAALAIPLLVLLLAQTILMFLYTNFVTFPVMGKDYDAAVLAAGHCGFGMGATPNGVANMESVVDKFIDSKMAFFVLPIVGGMFIDFANVMIIIVFLTFI